MIYVSLVKRRLRATSRDEWQRVVRRRHHGELSITEARLAGRQILLPCLECAPP